MASMLLPVASRSDDNLAAALQASLEFSDVLIEDDVARAVRASLEAAAGGEDDMARAMRASLESPGSAVDDVTRALHASLELAHSEELELASLCASLAPPVGPEEEAGEEEAEALAAVAAVAEAEALAAVAAVAAFVAAEPASTASEAELVPDNGAAGAGVAPAPAAPAASSPVAAPMVARQTTDEVRRVVAELDAEEVATRQAAELGPTFECQICLEEHVPMLGGHRLVTCGHTYCVGCLAGHVKVKVDGADVGDEALCCPGCSSSLTVADVHAVTWRCGDDETWRKYSERADEAAIEALVRQGRARRCPAATCNFTFEWSPGDQRRFGCPACSAAFCLQCDCTGGGVGPAHPGLACFEQKAKLEADAEAKRKLEEWQRENSRADARFRELLRSEMRTGETKPCPRCRQAITKAGGCHHHQCTTCKVKFCWRCGGYNAAAPHKNTCGTTCGKRERTWWDEADVLGAAEAGSSAAHAHGAHAMGEMLSGSIRSIRSLFKGAT